MFKKYLDVRNVSDVYVVYAVSNSKQFKCTQAREISPVQLLAHQMQSLMDLSYVQDYPAAAMMGVVNLKLEAMQFVRKTFLRQNNIF